MRPEARHDAVGRALVLDLDHRPLVGLIGERAVLDHHAVESGALEAGEPVGRHVGVVGDRRDVDRRKRLPECLLQRGAPLRVGRLDSERSPSASRSKATYEAGVDSASRRMRYSAGWIRWDSASNSKTVGTGNDDLAVEHAPLRELAPERATSSGK